MIEREKCADRRRHGKQNEPTKKETLNRNEKYSERMNAKIINDLISFIRVTLNVHKHSRLPHTKRNAQIFVTYVIRSYARRNWWRQQQNRTEINYNECTAADGREERSWQKKKNRNALHRSIARDSRVWSMNMPKTEHQTLSTFLLLQCRFPNERTHLIFTW